MAWTELTRRQHDRAGGKYASDLTDAEWALIVGVIGGAILDHSSGDIVLSRAA